MSMKNEIGFKINIDKNNSHYFLFGEDQSRYVISSTKDNIDNILSILKEENIIYEIIGTTTKGNIIVNDEQMEIKEIKDLYENWFINYLNKD